MNGLAMPDPREREVEVWTTCLDCHAEVRLLGRDWHHAGPADHPGEPTVGSADRVRVLVSADARRRIDV